ncbi:MAG TPA: 4-(cytidine 5'-diphospho)-2-C-methyl-D-erythritol kinase [Acidimicrobiales bacterium]|jgi:4-diphosphocytidyl-2-C-methyl-D-erythritol kinase|nr:4-(cytidine 5'-diphospho)-2-C-methyl-D-erythritol kinase [Acidimicrobiales bacterium]
MTTVLARAKLTLSLRVTGVRADGYHLLDSEMVTLDLADRLTFAEGDGLTVSGRGAGGPVPGDDGNLVRKALRAAGRSASVHLEKVIPTGGGLGGGSADAAAVLRWAGIDDPQVAVKLGADVPFCLIGGRARVRGVGEDIVALPFEEVAGDTYTLLTPPLHVSTVEVYRAWDLLGGPTGEQGNDLEPAALHVAPGLAGWRDRLAEATGQTPRLAGSGATWFVPGAFEAPGLTVVRVDR